MPFLVMSRNQRSLLRKIVTGRQFDIPVLAGGLKGRPLILFRENGKGSQPIIWTNGKMIIRNDPNIKKLFGKQIQSRLPYAYCVAVSGKFMKNGGRFNLNEKFPKAAYQIINDSTEGEALDPDHEGTIYTTVGKLTQLCGTYLRELFPNAEVKKRNTVLNYLEKDKFLGALFIGKT